MKVKAVSVKCFELFALDGTSLGLFKVQSEWHGFRKLISLSQPHHEVIVDATDDGVRGIFEQIFGEQRAYVDVLKATPDLAADIKKGATS